MKMSQATLRLYEEMSEPKYVIAMGACMISGGMFSADSPTAVRGADKILPIDVYIPGCPPRPEAIIDAIVKLRKKIANESIQQRDKITQTYRYYSIPHKMKPVPNVHNGQYLDSPAREKPPEILTEAMGMLIPRSLRCQLKKKSRKESYSKSTLRNTILSSPIP
jgi:NAD(P)H-quinone oxidoreductase subunit K